MAVAGLVVGMWWLREKDATTPSLRTDPGQKPPSPEKTTPPPTQTPPSPDPAPIAATPDDLTQINGIGPAFAKALNALGITSFAQLAEQDAASLAERLEVRGVTAERIQREEWIEQAKQQSEG